MVDVMNIVNVPMIYISTWFTQILNASGVGNAYLVVIFIVLVVRFFVVPVFGRSRGSDRSRKKVGDDNE